MRRKMQLFFKFGLTVVVLVAIGLFYFQNSDKDLNVTIQSMVKSVQNRFMGAKTDDTTVKQGKKPGASLPSSEQRAQKDSDEKHLKSKSHMDVNEKHSNKKVVDGERFVDKEEEEVNIKKNDDDTNKEKNKDRNEPLQSNAKHKSEDLDKDGKKLKKNENVQNIKVPSESEIKNKQIKEQNKRNEEEEQNKRKQEKEQNKINQEKEQNRINQEKEQNKINQEKEQNRINQEKEQNKINQVKEQNKRNQEKEQNKINQEKLQQQNSPQLAINKDNEKIQAGAVEDPPEKTAPDGKLEIHISLVACGDRLEESMVAFKSAAIMSAANLHFHIFADDALRPQFDQQLKAWPAAIQSRLTVHLYPIQYPPGVDAAKWMKVFKLCATQRLFIPSILTSVDALLYIDTDILFMRPVEDVWNHFTRFNSSHISALSPEHEEPSAGWYNRFARHPYVHPLGVNSGVMLMNLTRMREAEWVEHIVPYYDKYHLKITWGDQDLINIFFHYFPDKLYSYDCNWNYRPDHCMYMSNCNSAQEFGISVVHGCRGTYHNDKQPVFKAIYQAFKEYEFGSNMMTSLVQPMEAKIMEHKHTPCGRVSNLFLHVIRTTALNMRDRFPIA